MWSNTTKYKEFESYQEGVLLYLGVEEGKSAPVNGILAILGKEGEDYKPLLDVENAKQLHASTFPVNYIHNGAR